ncbi:DsrE family protein [Thiolinea disciformis]|uniref:DsrE family protein n=1 Tax=Thiolinea disciformis TaxID=125614 RepID=UPI00036C9FE9|nr:DsrE family protein [Thiolinea disciformis]
MPNAFLQSVNTRPPVSLYPNYQPKRAYVIVLTTGSEDQGKRATLALSTACSALAIDMQTHLFLVGDGSHWAYQGHAEQVHQTGFPSLIELLETYLELGGKIYLCSACDQVCSAPLSNGSKNIRRSEIELRGLVSILDFATEGTTITF